MRGYGLTSFAFSKVPQRCELSLLAMPSPSGCSIKFGPADSSQMICRCSVSPCQRCLGPRPPPSSKWLGRGPSEGFGGCARRCVVKRFLGRVGAPAVCWPPGRAPSLRHGRQRNMEGRPHRALGGFLDLTTCFILVLACMGSTLA